MNIKIIISLIAVAISSISIVEAAQYRHDGDRRNSVSHSRNFDNPRAKHHFRQDRVRKHWKHAKRHNNRHRVERHGRKHQYYGRHISSHGYNYRLKHARRHHYKHYSHGRSYYRHTPRYVAPRHSSHVVVRTRHHSNRVLPALAGGLIGSAIANDASHGDPGATVGGAVVGAIIGDAIGNH